MSKLETTKSVVSFISGYGSSVIAGHTIKNNLNTDVLKTHQKISVLVAGFFIGGAVSEAMKPATDRQIDDIVNAYNKLKKNFS